ncbi:winged helix-turn-helix transcriptional regulator [Phytohabitans houttuyneae]|uniref:ArsR family transcriptional regulator n=1 Tax=Phytohabitans houttuyneae TaxID=1076126 RepID=A0A6V8K5G8_9ACTN|nr:helix-turn-helix domain-containing protein [Phytohabitans houttuyneae]GFJ77226.1 ArsR family transcriptional regulator [Phytohabitans houttuyneae]
MALGKNYEGQNCSLARALELVGERWTLLIVRDAFYGVHRYGDLLAHLDIPRAVLADRLATLVEAGILERHRYQDSPPRDEYKLTARGVELWSVIFPLMSWGERHFATGKPLRTFRHAKCGTEIDPASRCPTCGNTDVPPADIESHPGPGKPTHPRQDPVSVALRAGPHRLLQPVL